MNTQVKRLTAVILLCIGVTGCSQTAVSTHAPVADPVTNSIHSRDISYVYNRDGVVRHSPQSDHTSLMGDNSARLLQLGKENFADRNYGLSEEYFRKAVEMRTDSAAAWAGLAASYDQLGNFKLADRAYKQLVDLKGNDPRVLNNLGYSHLLRGDYKKARHYFSRAQDANPALEEVQGNLHLLEKVMAG